MLRGASIILLAIAFGIAQAAELNGHVLSVADGDTITILDSSKMQHRIRLAGIDAPERGQPFGNRSRENLARWVGGQSVVVDWHKRDQYGRLVGVVLAQGHDVNLEQVRAGFAWWYREYAREQSVQDRASYSAAETEARSARRGLWSDAEPVPPWEWRASRSNKS
jgi:endonuclease YncB( thermonuclease family)